VHSQDEGKWQFGVFLTPRIDVQPIQLNTKDIKSRFFLKNNHDLDKVRFGLSIGFAVYYNINENMRFKTGLEFSQISYYYSFILSDELDSLINNPSSTNYSLSFFPRLVIFKNKIRISA